MAGKFVIKRAKDKELWASYGSAKSMSVGLPPLAEFGITVD